MLETKDITNKPLFQGEANQIQITHPGSKGQNTRNDNTKQNGKFKSLLLRKVNNFSGGQLEKHVKTCGNLINDPNILSIIFGNKIEFVGAPRIQHKARSPQFLDEEINLIKDEIDKLLTKVFIKENLS